MVSQFVYSQFVTGCFSCLVVSCLLFFFFLSFFFVFFQAEDGIRDLVRSRGLGDVYKRQLSQREKDVTALVCLGYTNREIGARLHISRETVKDRLETCLLYTSDAADERSSVDLGGRRIIKKKKTVKQGE